MCLYLQWLETQENMNSNRTIQIISNQSHVGYFVLRYTLTETKILSGVTSGFSFGNYL